MRQEILTGAERRRRWSDEQKLAIVGEVGVAEASVADVARRHDVARQQIYAWRRQLRQRGLLAGTAPVFLPVSVASQPDAPGATALAETASAGMVEVRLANGRSLAVTTDMPAAVLQQLIRTVEAA